MFNVKSMAAVTLAAGMAISSADARNLGTGIGVPKVINLSTERRTVTNPVQRDRLRRRDTIKAELDNEEVLYFVNGTVGTPPQTVRMHLDTGSSDLWINTPSSALCSRQSQPCMFSGTYAANASSTYEYVGSWFNISYVDGSGASGDYVTDTITIGESTLDRLQFGAGYESTSAQAILGIGYPANEVQVGRAQMDPYENLPMKMVSAGQISRNVYSLWLNDLDANKGSILFGGVDTEQYIGSLGTLPIQSESDIFSEFLITMTSLQMANTPIATDQALAVLLDSGSSLTYLPDAMVESIYQQVKAQYDPAAGAAYVPCALANSPTTLDFTFSKPKISVAMNELVLDLITTTGKRPTFSDGVTACLFGISPAGQGTNVLGDTFLRSAYVVYDLDNNEISLAQTNFNATASNVVEIGSGAGVPDATLVANAVQATEGVVRGGRNSNAAVGGLGDEEGAATVVLASESGLTFLISIGVATFIMIALP